MGRGGTDIADELVFVICTEMQIGLSKQQGGNKSDLWKRANSLRNHHKSVTCHCTALFIGLFCPKTILFRAYVSAKSSS